MEAITHVFTQNKNLVYKNVLNIHCHLLSLCKTLKLLTIGYLFP